MGSGHELVDKQGGTVVRKVAPRDGQVAGRLPVEAGQLVVLVNRERAPRGVRPVEQLAEPLPLNATLGNEALDHEDMREDYTLLTPENVELRYDVAGLGSRLIAATLDYAILFLGYLALAFGLGMVSSLVVGSFLSLEQAADAQTRRVLEFVRYAAIALTLLVTFLGWWGYFILFELLWNGQSPGKRALRLRVVGAGGQPVSATASLVRNLLRAVDNVLGLGVVVMLVDRSSRRLGDFAAGTLVIREPAGLRRTALAPVEITEPPAGMVESIAGADRLTAEHYALIREYFVRRPRLTRARADALAAALAPRLAQVMDVPTSEVGEPTQFLAAAARAYERAHQY